MTTSLRRQKAFRIASGASLAAWVGTALCAALVATAGAIGLLGWGDYRYELEVPVPGLSVGVGFQPSWGVTHVGDVCERVDVRNPAEGCYGLALYQEDREVEGPVWAPGDVRPVAAVLSGELLLDAEPGWNPLIASLYAMRVLALSVLAFLLAQLWLLLRAAGDEQGFSEGMVRRLRVLGATMVAWELAEPLLWLFLSPKAHDYSMTATGPWPLLAPGSMEPGGPAWLVIAFGLLLLLLAELFRHGSELADEQRLTV